MTTCANTWGSERLREAGPRIRYDGQLSVTMGLGTPRPCHGKWSWGLPDHVQLWVAVGTPVDGVGETRGREHVQGVSARPNCREKARAKEKKSIANCRQEVCAGVAEQAQGEKQIMEVMQWCLRNAVSIKSSYAGERPVRTS